MSTDKLPFGLILQETITTAKVLLFIDICKKIINNRSVG